MASKTQKHCGFDDIPWEIKLEIFRFAWDKSNLVKVSKEWRNLVLKHGKKRDEFVRVYINQLTRNGYLELLKWLSTQMDITKYWNDLTCAFAAKGGHLKVLKWLKDPAEQPDGVTCPWDEWTCAFAARGGYVDVLKWLRSEGCPWSKWTCTHAAWGGHLEVLKWLRDPAEHPDGVCPWEDLTCIYAAQGGHLDVLKWLRANGCPE